MSHDSFTFAFRPPSAAAPILGHSLVSARLPVPLPVAMCMRLLSARRLPSLSLSPAARLSEFEPLIEVRSSDVVSARFSPSSLRALPLGRERLERGEQRIRLRATLAGKEVERGGEVTQPLLRIDCPPLELRNALVQRRSVGRGRGIRPFSRRCAAHDRTLLGQVG